MEPSFIASGLIEVLFSTETRILKKNPLYIKTIMDYCGRWDSIDKSFCSREKSGSSIMLRKNMKRVYTSKSKKNYILSRQNLTRLYKNGKRE